MQGTAVYIGPSQVLLMGGETAVGSPTPTVECIDVITGMVSPLPALPSPLLGRPSAATLGDNVFLMGGN